MKTSLHPYLFVGAILIISISLWDYFALRMIEDIPKSIEAKQLFPGIIGALLLIVSPIFEKRPAQWLHYTIMLFLFITIILWIKPSNIIPSTDAYYYTRHITGSVLLTVLLFIIYLSNKTRRTKS